MARASATHGQPGSAGSEQPSENKMIAIVRYRYGSPDVLKLEDLVRAGWWCSRSQIWPHVIRRRSQVIRIQGRSANSNEHVLILDDGLVAAGSRIPAPAGSPPNAVLPLP